MLYGVILAAGVGKRMKQKTPKQYLKINNKPLLFYSIDKFLEINKIDKIILVLNKNLLQKSIFDEIIKKYKKYIHTSKINIIDGGKERYDSVNNALKFIDENFCIKKNDKIIIHDAARPNFDIIDTKKLISYINKYKSITLGTKVFDTIKEINETNKNDVFEVIKTCDRNKYYLIKTPQGFHLRTLYDCYKEFYIDINKNKKVLVTDDIQIIEKYSKIKSYIMDSSILNYKITTKDDLNMIKYLL